MPGNASQDANQVYSMLGVGGTAGTADTKGTSTTVAVAVNPTTGAQYFESLGGTVTASPEKASGGTLTNVAVSTANATLLSSNASRKKAVVVNDTSSNLYVKYGSTAATTSYSYLLQPFDALEEYTYTGRIDGILDSGSGTARMTEL